MLLLDLLLDRSLPLRPFFLGAPLFRAVGLLLLDHALERVDLRAGRSLELLDASLELVHALSVGRGHGDGTEQEQGGDDGRARGLSRSHVTPPDGRSRQGGFSVRLRSAYCASIPPYRAQASASRVDDALPP